jgi:hypothetical protein
MGALAFAGVGQNSLGRLEIGVEVAENGESHVGRNVKIVTKVTKLKS